MKKILFVFVLVGCMTCQLACAAQAGNGQTAITPAPAPEPEEQVAERDAEQLENAQELAEAEREYQEEVAEIQREWAEEQKELRDEMAGLEQEWKNGEFDSRQEFNEELQEYNEEMAEAQKEMQEELNEALAELEEARRDLAGRVTRDGRSNFKFTAPNIEIFAQPRFPFSTQPEQSVLFIPQKPIDEKVAEQISEDMQVMSMILEKTVNESSHSGHSGFGGGRGTGLFHGYSSGVPESIYIEDYGMIFKLQVDFPLLAIGGDEQPKPQIEEDTQDEVWQRSKKQLKGLDEPVAEKDDSNKFDPSKVDLLKEKLIGAFKHASNIRNLSGDERIVFVVSGHVDNQPGRFYGGTGRTSGEGDITVPTSVMTLQAAKQDVDAFAAGKLDLDKFTQKTNVVIY